MLRGIGTILVYIVQYSTAFLLLDVLLIKTIIVKQTLSTQSVTINHHTVPTNHKKVTTEKTSVLDVKDMKILCTTQQPFHTKCQRRNNKSMVVDNIFLAKDAPPPSSMGCCVVAGC